MGAARVLDGDEVQGVLSGSFYSPATSGSFPRVPERAKAIEKRAHYKVICISMYTEGTSSAWTRSSTS